jgi:succinate dehydrogenase / fumarate reductase membrane anchor subunit
VYHSQLGIQVVVEDYVAHHGYKVAVLLLLNFLHVALAAQGVFAVLRIAFGTPA